MQKHLLLISNSRAHGQGYLDHCEADLRSLLKGKTRILFIPYARPGGISHAEYAGIARERYAKMNIEVDSIHEATNPRRAVDNAEALFIGGGNTFLLLKSMYDAGVLEHIRRRVEEGMPYAGTSAGANVACPTIMTTNDMPIVFPPRFEALYLVPFQINPHYLDPDPNSKHQGETRETRIREFLVMNDRAVVGLREGAMLLIDWPGMKLIGLSGMRLFRKDREAEEFEPGSKLDFLIA